MAIDLKVSNSLKALSNQITEDLMIIDPSPFTKQWIVTQTDGINNWLKYNIAERLGVAANIQFIQPNDVSSMLYNWICPDKKPLLDVEIMKWTLYSLLDEPDFNNRFAGYSSYYAGDKIKQFALAEELADLFDQYQVYRAEKIEEWNNRIQEIENCTDWQEYLWIKIKMALSDSYIDRSEMSKLLLSSLVDKENHAILKEKIPTLHFFGMAIITPFYLRLFYELANIISVKFYLQNPAPQELWINDLSDKQLKRWLRYKKIDPAKAVLTNTGNDLLLNWGSVIKDSYKLLLEQDDYLNVYDDSLVVLPDNSSKLLGKIQSDIFNNANNENRLSIQSDEIHDGSLTINGCYTPAREVEVLYNYLMELTDKRNVELSARDIVVMVSDIDLYAPYIDAVFGNSNKRFPYTIADEIITSGNNLFTAIQDILSVNLSSFKAEEVLGLLESPLIRKRFSFSDTDAVRKVVRQAGIFFGTDGKLEGKKTNVDDEAWMLSWEYGLKKILYGICMSGGEEFNDGLHVFSPLDTAEGSATMDRIRLIHFIEVLRKNLEQRDRERTITEWAEYLQQIVDNLIFNPDEQEDSDYQLFVQLLEKMTLLDDKAATVISFDVFRQSFLKRMNREKRLHRFGGAGITFCSLLPMRSIPFEVVAMLGMNFDKFPRKESPLSFNIIQNDKRPGDRNIRENDKHLFLETLLSAGEFLYISYLGRSEKDGSEQPPSSLIDELIDYVARGANQDTDDLKKEWITIHPLHGFSSKYDDEKLFNYLTDKHFKSDEKGTANKNTQNEIKSAEINIEQLSRFYNNPAKYFLNKRFDVYYFEMDELIPEHELFELGKLDSWGIEQTLIENSYKDKNQLTEKLKKEGKLPLSNMGIVAINKVEAEIDTIKKLFIDYTENKKSVSIDIDIKDAEFVLSGKINEIYGDRMIVLSNSKTDPYKSIIQSWVKYIALIAHGVATEFVFISTKTESALTFPAGKISRDDAMDILKRYVELFRKGQEKPLPFTPALSRNNFKMIKSGYEDFRSQYEAAMESERDFTFKEKYLVKMIEGGLYAEENYEELKQNTFEIMSPLIEHFPELF